MRFFIVCLLFVSVPFLQVFGAQPKAIQLDSKEVTTKSFWGHDVVEGVEFLRLSVPLQISDGSQVNAIRLEAYRSAYPGSAAQFGVIDKNFVFHPTYNFTQWDYSRNEDTILIGETGMGYIVLNTRSGILTTNGLKLNPGVGSILKPKQEVRAIGLKRK